MIGQEVSAYPSRCRSKHVVLSDTDVCLALKKICTVPQKETRTDVPEQSFAACVPEQNFEACVPPSNHFTLCN